MDAFIVDYGRTPFGRNHGLLAPHHPVDLTASLLDAILRRAGYPLEDIQDVILGCVGTYGAQSANIARSVVLASELLPDSVPGVTVDRQCGSSLQAIQFASEAVVSAGTCNRPCIIIAGGVESMSTVPIGAQIFDAVQQQPSRGHPFASKRLQHRFSHRMESLGSGIPCPSQFLAAEIVAEKFGISRHETDAYALLSHERASKAKESGVFEVETVLAAEVNPQDGTTAGSGKMSMGGSMHSDDQFSIWDESVRTNASFAALKQLKTILTKKKGAKSNRDYVHTAASTSPISDGAAILVIVNRAALERYGLVPMARIHTVCAAAGDPITMLDAPILATKKALQMSNLTLHDLARYEVNEAFASVPLAWLRAFDGVADLNKLNVHGGALSLGHPLGATGARLVGTLMYELHRILLPPPIGSGQGVVPQGRYGLVTICEAGGTANALILERVGSIPPILFQAKRTLPLVFLTRCGSVFGSLPRLGTSDNAQDSLKTEETDTSDAISQLTRATQLVTMQSKL